MSDRRPDAADLPPDVIDDLLALSRAGEASPGTQAWVEHWLAEHPTEAARLRSGDRLTHAAPAAPPLEDDTEMTSLKRTRGLLRWQSWLLGFAIFFTASLFSFGSFDERGVHFIVLGSNAWPVFLAGSLICWSGWLGLRATLRV